jgi:hypothetical protein
MFEILTNPSTLLCLGVVFLLISVLFFYFKRSISLLERAQMEQARILQSFITNMEMSHQMSHQLPPHTRQNINSIDTNNHQSVSNEQSLIDVSDEGDSDDESNSDSDEDSNSDSDDGHADSDDGHADSDDDDKNLSYKMPIVEIDQLENNDDIKIIHLQDNNLEEFHPEILEIIEIHNYDEDNEDNEDDEDDDDDSSIGDDSNRSLSEEEPQIVENVKKENTYLADFKNLSVQTLRQIAEDSKLVKKGEKKTKKELLSLLENTKE